MNSSKLHRIARIVLAVLLLGVGLATMWSLWWFLQRFEFNFDAVIVLLGNLVTLAFCVFFAKELLGKGPISRGSLVVGAGFSVVAVLLVGGLLSGMYADSVGEQCSGLMGSMGSCTFGPQLLAMLVLFSPLSVAVLGAIAALGIFGQLSVKKTAAKNVADTPAQKKPQ